VLSLRSMLMPERLDLPVQLPQFDVMPVNELLGEPYGFCLVLTHEVYAILDVTIWSQNEGAVTLHGTVSKGFWPPQIIALGTATSTGLGHVPSGLGAAGRPSAFWFAYDSVTASQANSFGTVH
jgi:hypothetical protein